MILLVEDDVCYLRVIPHMLKMHNIKVTAINKVEEAQNWLSGNNCETVIINLHLRDGQGVDFLRWIEAKDLNLRIIILDNPNRSNYSSVDIDHDYEVISVPFNGEQLIKTISI